jgi:hypothetical protein
MQMKNYFQGSLITTGLAVALAFATYAPSAHANVYASNIKVNGVLTGSATVGQGIGATITYILNEPASSGLAVKIYSGATLVRTITIAGGSPGTTQGLNAVAWNGKDDSSVNVPVGNYKVSITAGSNGYLDWTPIVDNLTDIWWPSGIAVDTRIDSAYYGRVMVANGVNTANAATHPPGIFKFNADGSFADEGQSNAGNPFRTDGYLGDSCSSLRYGTDDRVYWIDWVTMGKVYAADMAMTTNQLILNCDLNPTLSSLVYGVSGIDVTDPGTTNALIWVADAADYPSVGVWAFPLTNNGVADSVNGGINVLATGPNIPLVTGPGLMITETGDIYIGASRNNASDPTSRAFSITNVWPSAVDGSPTNWWNTAGTYPITDINLKWSVGGSDDTFRNEYAVAIDSRTSPKYVSVAMNGGSGGLRILNAVDGTLVTNINQNVGVYYIGTCFDAVGNVYAGDASTASSWWAFSPPGTNQATTPAVVSLQVVVPPHITSIAISAGTATIHFTAGATDPSSAFTLVSAGVVNGTYLPAPGAVITGSGGTYQAIVATSGSAQFYRIKR